MKYDSNNEMQIAVTKIRVRIHFGLGIGRMLPKMQQVGLF